MWSSGGGAGVVGWVTVRIALQCRTALSFFGYCLGLNTFGILDKQQKRDRPLPPSPTPSGGG